MKVCLASKNFTLSNGLGRVALEVLSGLQKRGHLVSCVKPDSVTNAGYLKHVFFDSAIKLPRGYDVYHSITPLDAIWFPKNKGIVNFYSLSLGRFELYSGWERVLGSLVYRYGRKIASRCRFIICASEEGRNDLIKTLGVSGDKIKVLRLGIRPDLEPQAKRDKTFRVGYLGELDARKRVSILVKAFKRSNIDGELVIGGRGVEEAMLKALAGDDSRIKFCGFVPDDHLVDFFNSLSVFVFPTSVEGFGLPIVEAMACKKPVVVLADALIPWSVKSRCIITDNLDGILSDSHSVDLDSNFKFAKLHSWDRYVDECLKLYEEVLC